MKDTSWTDICADLDGKFMEGTDRVFSVDENGNLRKSVIFDHLHEEYIDNTIAAQADKKFCEKLREYFYDMKEESAEPDPMDLARDKAVEDWDGKEGA